jgi:hypothetical protein
MYGLPVNKVPTLLGTRRVIDFKNIMAEELNEIDQTLKKYQFAKRMSNKQ